MADAELRLKGRDDTRAAFSSVENSLGGLQRQAESLRGAFAGIAGAIGVGMFVNTIRSTLELGDSLSKLSQRTGLAVESLSELQYAGKLANVGPEALSEGLKKLAVNLQSAAGGNKELQEAFKAIGISAGELRDVKVDEVVKRAADAFKGMEDGAGKTAIAVKLGGKAFDEWIPLLNGGAAGLREAAKEARAFGVVMTGEAAKSAEQFNDDLTRLQTAAAGFGLKLANDVLPFLGQVAKQMAEAAKEGGALWGVLRGIAEAGKIALQGGVDPTELKAQRDYILSIRGEIAKLQGSAAGKGALGTGLLDRLFYGDAADKKRKIAELQITLRDAERAFKNMQSQAAPAELPKGGTGGGGGGAGADASLPRVATPGRGSTIWAEMVLDQINDLQAQAKKIQDETRRSLEETQQDVINGIGVGPEIALRRQQAISASVDSLLAATPTGQVEGLNAQLDNLNDRLIRGEVSAKLYDEAFAGISKQLSAVRDVGAEAFDAINFSAREFQPFATDFMSQLQSIQYAVQNVGKAFEDSLIDAVKKGRIESGKILAAMAEDIARFAIRQSITAPLFNAIAPALYGGLGGLFGKTGGASTSADGFGLYGGQRASGGPVSAGVAYTVGEIGRETFVPTTDGVIVPAARSSEAMRVTQVFNISAGVDAGVITRAAAMGASLARSSIARDVRTGAFAS